MKNKHKIFFIAIICSFFIVSIFFQQITYSKELKIIFTKKQQEHFDFIVNQFIYQEKQKIQNQFDETRQRLMPEIKTKEEAERFLQSNLDTKIALLKILKLDKNDISLKLKKVTESYFEKDFKERYTINDNLVESWTDNFIQYVKEEIKFIDSVNERVKKLL